jgi:hypothetical protein
MHAHRKRWRLLDCYGGIYQHDADEAEGQVSAAGVGLGQQGRLVGV